MKRKLCFIWLIVFLVSSCGGYLPEDDASSHPSLPHVQGQTGGEFGGGGEGFKVPLPPGYPWEITQSWKDHCALCDAKGYPYPYTDYCNNSSTHYGIPSCWYGWDFNLPGSADQGKPVLASADGVVYDLAGGYNNGWGNTVRIDHGNNLCTRYSHLFDGSTDGLYEGQYICQGLKIGEIGASGGTAENPYSPHLHFQFEECDTKTPLSMGFTDGNGVPVCTIGSDVFDANGNYNFLILSNTLKYECDDEGAFSGGTLPEGGWLNASCGALPNCPLIPNCNRPDNHAFSDQSSIASDVAGASAYLYSECAVDGKADGGLHPNDNITRAEALKIPVFLFGLMFNCNGTEPYADVSPGDWFYQTVFCGVSWGILDATHSYFYPNDEVNLVEAAKMLVESASRWGIIEIKNPAAGHFPYIPKSHWGYKYVETLYAYGGLDNSQIIYKPDRMISRADYMVMAASMSPCYCRNISCESGCTCDQSLFACANPNDNTPSTGGGVSTPPPSGSNPPPSSGGNSSSGWVCDPAVGYPVYLNSANASIEALGLGAGGHYEGVPDTGFGVHVAFNCADLPGAMLIYATEDVLISTVNPNIPPFAVWLDYSGQLTASPSTGPEEVTDYFIGAPQTLLVRVPAFN